MATFKTLVKNRRADGTYKIYLRVTHNRHVRYLPTHLYVTDEDITKSLSIKNYQVLNACEELVRKCRNACNEMGYEIKDLSPDELTIKLDNVLKGGERFRLNFIEYMELKAADMKEGTGRGYKAAANALRRFVEGEQLDISDITARFLREFEKFIDNEPSQQGNNRNNTGGIKPKGGRAVSAYLAYIRATHNWAKLEFNDEDRKIINIPYSPFKNYKLKPQPITRKRAIAVSDIQKIIDLPYVPETIPGKYNRVNLAKDCFILSFALIGMNSADMYHAPAMNQNTVIYYRQKTQSRREDRAEMRVAVDGCLDYLLDKYKDHTGKRLFNFYQHYANATNLNRALNKGLKQIGLILGIDRLDFYTARHSWATIARSSLVGIDKETVHEALNHSDARMRVTDIYIDKDWSVIWNANRKVLDQFDWSAIGWGVL